MGADFTESVGGRHRVDQTAFWGVLGLPTAVAGIRDAASRAF